MRLGVWAAGLALAVWPASAGAQALPSRAEQLQKFAAALKRELEGNGGSSVQLGPIAAPRDSKANGGPGLANELANYLSGLGVKVEAAARFRLTGEYSGGQSEEENRLVLTVAFALADTKTPDRRPVKFPEFRLYEYEQFAPLLGLTLSLDPSLSDAKKDAQIKEQANNPRANIEGTRVFARPGSKYGVELLVKRGDKYEPLKPTDEGGMAFVGLARDDVYAVRVSNGTDAEAVVKVWIDGLDVMSFSEQRTADNRPRHTGFVMAARSEGNLRGWPGEKGKSREFLVAEYPQTAAQRLSASPGELGVITVSFAPAWGKSQKPPVFLGGKSVPLGTGFGAKIDTPAVEQERVLGAFNDAVNVRYVRN